MAAGQSYLTSEVRGSSREELPCVRGQGWRLRGATQVRVQGPRPGGATPRPRSGAVAKRSYPASEVGAAARMNYPVSEVRGGREELPHTPTPEARGGGREEQPHIQGAVAELSHVEGQEGSGEEIPLVQGKERRLCFAGAAMKRYSTPNVRET